jgi:rod shape determining protein RodA
MKMVGIDRRLLLNLDWPLLGATVALVALSAMTLATLQVGRTGSGIAVRQLAWFGVGLVALLVVASIDYRRLVRVAPLFYLAGLAVLVSVFIFGRTVSGAKRWLLIGPISVQPSEFFKIAFVLMLVWLLSTRWSQPVSKTVLAVAAPLAVVPAVLIVKQPDLGTALLLFPVLIALLVAAGMRLKILGGLGLVGLAAMPVAWFLLKDYQRDRILVFLDPPTT